MSILVVDDDHLIREGLCLMLRTFAGDEALLTAGHGGEALQVLLETPVDVIFTDIKMPVMDGLTLMAKLREMQYPGEVVIISGFDEFDFARRAIKLGAADYLLKPLKAEELGAVYAECKRRMALKGGLKPHMPPLPMATPYRQQAQLARLLSGGGGEDKDLPIIPPAAGHVVALVVDAFAQGRTPAWEGQSAFAMGQALLEALSLKPRPTLIQGEYRQNWVMLFGGEGELAPGAAAAIAEAAEQQGWHFGISQQAFSPQDCRAAYDQALSCLSQHFYDMPAQVKAQVEVFPYPQHTQGLTNAIAAIDTQEALGQLQSLFNQIALEHPNVDALRQHLISLIYTVMNQNKDFIGIIGKYKFTDHDIILKVREAPVFSRLTQDFQTSLLLYMKALQARRLSKDAYAIQRAKAYVDSSYQGSVSLVDISEKLGLHPNYLSSLFHHQTGQTFSEYLRCVRIQKALQLMKDTNLKVYEIAQQVGYGDTAQFHRSFKQTTGISPGQYKHRHM